MWGAACNYTTGVLAVSGAIRLGADGQMSHPWGVLMRRTAVAVIGFGCAIGVFAAAGTIPASASAADRNEASSSVSGAGASANPTRGAPADQTRATPSSQAKTVATSKLKTTTASKLKTTTASKLKTVEYDGYSVTVPSSWPVFNLDTDPGQCVRYDINAVYLGNPGANQNCPSNLIGRVQTITITDVGVSAHTAGPVPARRRSRMAASVAALPGSSRRPAASAPSRPC